MTFLRSDSPKKLDRIVLKCVWTFVLQFLLLALITYCYSTEKSSEGVVYIGLLRDVYHGDASLNMARMICAFLLHITVLPEIRSAKSMLSFAKKNITSFSDQRFSYPMMFAYFKLCGGFFCFFTNAFLCVYSDNIADVVKDFVAVSIISQIDDLMVGTLT